MNLAALNPQQRAAVCHGSGPLLLLAGAGSGKTRVITVRIAYLLRQRLAAAAEILAVTFTNKAAREMQERVADLVGREAARAMTISTFHSLCVRILREEIERLGYKRNFTIYASADQVRLVRDLLDELCHGERRFDAERIIWLISDAKNRLQGPESFVAKAGDDYAQMAARVYPRYQQRLKACNAVDFDDLLLLAVRLLREHPEVLTLFQERYRFILVDEYQDTNAAQLQLLRLLAEKHRNLCVVGDDDQSIYGWRGADPANILAFDKTFPGTTVIKLEQNYRSTGNILAAANAVIQNNAQRHGKALWSAGGAGTLIDYLRCNDEEEEARTVAACIQAERFKGERSWSDFAILYRTNAQSRAFEEALRYEKIPYVLIGGQQFFDRKEVKDVLAYLRILVNPRDEVNLLRILNFPRRGIGETSADRLIRASVALQRPLWEVLKQPPQGEELGEKVLGALRDFVALLERYRLRFRQSGRLADTLRALLVELQMEAEIRRMAQDPLRRKNDEASKAERRIDNLHEVVNALAGYEEREGQPTLTGFLEKVSLLDHEEPNRGSKEEKLAQEAVVLMSLHSSKGLEFPQVFLVGMEEGYLPFESDRSKADIDEERRLCYVGITRARRQLTLTGVARRLRNGKPVASTPSRFLAEIPAELLRQGSAAAPPAAPPEEQELIAKSFFEQMRARLEGG
jgi:DNA helicase-2/ATP-dependent DNA helicase PcrA